MNNKQQQPSDGTKVDMQTGSQTIQAGAWAPKVNAADHYGDVREEDLQRERPYISLIGTNGKHTGSRGLASLIRL